MKSDKSIFANDSIHENYFLDKFLLLYFNKKFGLNSFSI